MLALKAALSFISIGHRVSAISSRCSKISSPRCILSKISPFFQSATHQTVLPITKFEAPISRHYCNSVKALKENIVQKESKIKNEEELERNEKEQSKEVMENLIEGLSKENPEFEPLVNIQNFSDFRTPHEWYPKARSMTRKFIVHVGPTNSGKTFSALERLKESQSGLYCGPLRLLAEQVFEKLNLAGCPTDLLTGDKVIKLEDVDSDLRLRMACGDLRSFEKVVANFSTGGISGDGSPKKSFFTQLLSKDEVEEDEILALGSKHSGSKTTSTADFKLGLSDMVDGNGNSNYISLADEPSDEFVQLQIDQLEPSKIFELLSPPKHVSGTVEMANIGHVIDCAVIDEFQLMTDPDRGSAWTRAILGVPAKEIHLCGEPDAVPLLKSILKSTGDLIEVREYKRLSPLSVASEPLMKKGRAEEWMFHLQPGDAVIAFGRVSMFALKFQIEKAIRKPVCMVYGNLPSTTRTRQARRFNDPKSGANILVASDAIGLGLNLHIKRIIFSTAQKFDGTSVRNLTAREIKQIGGRAGRFGSQYPSGIVTSLKKSDLRLVADSFTSNIPFPKRAGLAPQWEHLKLMSDAVDEQMMKIAIQQRRLQYSKKLPKGADLDSIEIDTSKIKLPKVPLSKLLDAFGNAVTLSGTYFLCRLSNLIKVCKSIEHLELELKELMTFVESPVSLSNPIALQWVIIFASQYAKRSKMMKQTKESSKVAGDEEVEDEDDDQKHESSNLFIRIPTIQEMSNYIFKLDSEEGSVGSRKEQLWIHPDDFGDLNTGLKTSIMIPMIYLEWMHKTMELYMWLSYRFEGFNEVENCLLTSYYLEAKIAETLTDESSIAWKSRLIKSVPKRAQDATRKFRKSREAGMSRSHNRRGGSFRPLARNSRSL